MSKIVNEKSIHIIWVAIVLVFASVSSTAMSNPGKEKSYGPNFERLAAKLNLSEDQTQQFIEVMKIQHEKRKALRQEKRDEMKDKMQAHYADTVQALTAILTEEQVTAFEQHVEKRRQKRKMQRNSQNPDQSDGS